MDNPDWSGAHGEKAGSPAPNVPKGSPRADLSKTEASKKATVEVTEQIVVGYVCVGGGGNWCV